MSLKRLSVIKPHRTAVSSLLSIITINKNEINVPKYVFHLFVLAEPEKCGGPWHQSLTPHATL